MAILDKALPVMDTMMSKQKHAKISFKFWFKKATLLKRASTFRLSYNTLNDLAERTQDRMKSQIEGSAEHRAASEWYYRVLRE